MIYDVKDDPIIQVSNQELSMSPNTGFISQIMSDLDQTFRMGPLPISNLIFDDQLDSNF